jgi:chaperonin GroES
MNALTSLSQLDPLAADAARPRITPPDPQEVERLKRWAASPNIALLGRGDDDSGEPEVADEQLSKLGMAVFHEYEIDDNSRAEWKEQNREAMKLAMQIAETKQYPWPKSSNIIFPVLTTAAIQFAARAYPAIVMGRDVVKGVVIGPDDGVPIQGQGGPLSTQQSLGSPAPIPNSTPAALNLPGSQGAGAPGAGAPAPIQWAPGPDGTPQTPGLKQARADKIGQHMSYQLLDEQPEWEPEMDTLLHVVPIVGCDFKKSYFDSAEKMNVSCRVSAMDLVINYKAKSLQRAPRLTEEIEYYPNEIEEMERAGVFRKIVYTPQSMDGDDDAPVKFLEQHRWWDFDDDGLKEPYIVTIEKQSHQVVRIVARYELDGIKYNFTKGRIQKIEPIHYYTKYDFLPNVDGGIYGMGFGQLLKPLNEGINTSLNMLIDSGHLANVQGGFIGKGLSMNTGSMRFQPGEWKIVNAAGAAVRDALVPLKFDGPSPVLFQLLGMLIEAAKEVSGVKDVLTGEALPANTPATTMLAMIEQGLKTYTAIYKRIHRALKSELAKLYRLNRIYLQDEASYQIGDTWKTITRADYEKGSGVEPVSDPTIVTDMQKLGQAQFLDQFRDDPMLRGMEIRRRMLKAANIPNIEQLINPNPPPNPAVVAKMLDLQLKKQALDVKQRHEAASLGLRAQHDAALIESEEARAINLRAGAVNQLAQGDKAVGDQTLALLAHQLEAIKTQMDFLMQARAADAQDASSAVAPADQPQGAMAQ